MQFSLGVIGLAVKKTKMWLLPRAVRIYIYHRILSLKLCVKLCVLVCHQNLLVAGGFGDHALVLLGDLLDVTDHVEGVLGLVVVGTAEDLVEAGERVLEGD